MSTARKPKPVPASMTVTIRARSVFGVKSPMPRVVNVVPLTYRWPRPERWTSKPAAHNSAPKPVMRMPPQSTNRTIMESGPYVLRKVSRQSLGRMRRPAAAHGFQESVKKIFDMRIRLVTRRGRMIVSNASLRAIATRMIPSRAAAICIGTSNPKGDGDIQACCFPPLTRALSIECAPCARPALRGEGISSPLEGAGEEAADEVAAQQYINDEGRQRREERARHLDLVRGEKRAGEPVQGHRDWPLVWLGDDHQREQELVPDARELPDQDHDETRDGERDEDAAVDAEHRCAIDSCRLQHLIGDRRVVVPEDQRADRDAVDDVDQDQARDAAVQPDLLEHEDHRDQDALVRDEHPEQQQREEEVCAAESPLGQHVTVERAEQRRQERRGYYQLHAVYEVRQQLFDRGAVRLEGGRRGQLPRSAVRDLDERLERRDHNHVDRQEIEDAHDKQQRVADEGPGFEPPRPAAYGCRAQRSTSCRMLQTR